MIESTHLSNQLFFTCADLTTSNHSINKTNNEKKTLMPRIKYATKIVFIWVLVYLRRFEEQKAHGPHLLTWVNSYKSLSMHFSLLVVMYLPNCHFGCHSNQSNSTLPFFNIWLAYQSLACENAIDTDFSELLSLKPIYVKYNKSFSYQDTPPLRSFLVCIVNFDNKNSKNFSKCNHLFGRYLGETHFVHKSRAITRLKK